jgi:flagellar biosynthetic protein FliR
MQNILFSEISTFFLCFMRILGLFMLTPIFAQKEFFSQAKAIFAALLALFIMPLVSNYLPNTEHMGYEMFVYHMGVQFSIGLLMGMAAHCLFMMLDIVGHFMGSESGLSNAQTLNPSLGVSTELTTTILTVSACVLLFAFDFHHLMIKLLIESYSCFDITTSHFIQDFHIVIVNSMKKMFIFGLQFSFPFIIVGLILNISIGLINKLIPQIQIFSVMPPAQLIVGFLLLTILLPYLLEGFISVFKDTYIHLFERTT